MRFVHAFGAVVLVVLGFLGLAAPAQADPQVLEGKYNFQLEDGSAGVLTVWPSCVPTVGDLREPLYLPVACHLAVSPSGVMKGGDARVTGGVWAYTAPNAEGMDCPDGTKAPTTERIILNTDTWTGTRSVMHNAVCGLQPGMVRTNFTFSFAEPAPIPVEQYPLICEPGGLRRCF